MAKIVVVGSINVDLIARVSRHPAPGETLMGSELEVLPGGKGANQAVAAARLGSTVAMVSAVGRDAFADIALSGLRAAEVDLSHVEAVPGATGAALITVSSSGENAIVVTPGANAAVTPTTLESSRDLIADADVVILQGELPPTTIEAAVAIARGRVILNLAPVVRLTAQTLRRADPLVVNEHEARGALALVSDGGEAETRVPSVTPREGEMADSAPSVTLREVAGSSPSLKALTDADVVTALLDAGVPAVVLTRGSAGALVGDRQVHDSAGSGVETISAPVVEAVDTTGAGDAFVGALAQRLASGETLVEAARFAVRVGAFAVTGRGAQPSYPYRGDPLPI